MHYVEISWVAHLVEYSGLHYNEASDASSNGRRDDIAAAYLFPPKNADYDENSHYTTLERRKIDKDIRPARRKSHLALTKQKRAKGGIVASSERSEPSGNGEYDDKAYWESVKQGDVIRRQSIQEHLKIHLGKDPLVPEPNYPSFWRSNSPLHNKAYPDPSFFERIGVRVIKNGNSYQKFEFHKWAQQPGIVALVSPKDQHLVFSWTESSTNPSDLMYWCWQAGAAAPPGRAKPLLKYITIYDARKSSSTTLDIVTTAFKKRKNQDKPWFSMKPPAGGTIDTTQAQMTQKEQ
ncbi:hypothetical protein ABW20_dc0110213 [Dactylellina cionopaga]|nr:hypothetical protein ABW20_dc0110213 [Dactylellina cionopaga]